MANTFLVAQGFNLGKSLYEKDCIDIAKSILRMSDTNKRKRTSIPAQITKHK